MTHASTFLFFSVPAPAVTGRCSATPIVFASVGLVMHCRSASGGWTPPTRVSSLSSHPQCHLNCQDLARRPRRRRLTGRRVSNLLLMVEPAIGLYGVSIRRHWLFPVPDRASELFREVSRVKRSETHCPAAYGGCVGVRAPPSGVCHSATPQFKGVCTLHHAELFTDLDARGTSPGQPTSHPYSPGPALSIAGACRLARAAVASPSSGERPRPLRLTQAHAPPDAVSGVRKYQEEPLKKCLRGGGKQTKLTCRGESQAREAPRSPWRLQGPTAPSAGRGPRSFRQRNRRSGRERSLSRDGASLASLKDR